MPRHDRLLAAPAPSPTQPGGLPPVVPFSVDIDDLGPGSALGVPATQFPVNIDDFGPGSASGVSATQPTNLPFAGVPGVTGGPAFQDQPLSQENQSGNFLQNLFQKGLGLLTGDTTPGGAVGQQAGAGLTAAFQAIMANPSVFPAELVASLNPEQFALALAFFESQQRFSQERTMAAADLTTQIGTLSEMVSQGKSDRSIATSMLTLAREESARTGEQFQQTLERFITAAEEDVRLRQAAAQARVDQELIDSINQSTIARRTADFRGDTLDLEREANEAQALFNQTVLEQGGTQEEATALFRLQQQEFQRGQALATQNFRTLQEGNRALEAGQTATFRADQLRQQQLEAIQTAEFRIDQLGLQREQLEVTKTLGEEGISVAREQLAFDREVAEIDEELALAGLDESRRNRKLREELGVEQNLIDRARVTAEERRIDVEAAVALVLQQSRSETSLQQTAMENPFGFAALNTLGGFPGAGGQQQGQGTNPFLSGLAPLGFQVPQGTQAGQAGPASQFFQGGIPSLGQLQQIAPDALQFLQSILGFTGTSPQGFGRQSAAITPGTQPHFELPQLLGGVPVGGRG